MGAAFQVARLHSDLAGVAEHSAICSLAFGHSNFLVGASALPVPHSTVSELLWRGASGSARIPREELNLFLFE